MKNKSKFPAVIKERFLFFCYSILSLFTEAYSKFLPESIKTAVFGFKAKRAFNRAAKKAALQRKADLTNEPPKIKKIDLIKQTFSHFFAYIHDIIRNAMSRRAFNIAAKKAAKERRAMAEQPPESISPKKRDKNVKKASRKNTKDNLKENSTKKKTTKKKFSLFRRLVSLLLKVMLFGVCLIIVFGYIFGLSRNQSLNMQPAFQDGDLIFFFRSNKHYKANDTVLIIYEEKNMVERVVAVGGDKVDITEDGLVVNNGLVQEPYAWGATTQFENGVTFPLTVPEGKVFVLGDNREHAMDSRILGCIDEKEISGNVIGSFRRRNF